jgi:hypothetical protein
LAIGSEISSELNRSIVVIFLVLDRSPTACPNIFLPDGNAN